MTGAVVTVTLVEPVHATDVARAIAQVREAGSGVIVLKAADGRVLNDGMFVAASSAGRTRGR